MGHLVQRPVRALYSQVLHRQSAQFLAQTLSRSYFCQWRQQVGAVEKPFSQGFPPTAQDNSWRQHLPSTCDL